MLIINSIKTNKSSN